MSPFVVVSKLLQFFRKCIMKIKLSNYWFKNLYGQLLIYGVFITYLFYKIGRENAELIKANDSIIYYLFHIIFPIIWGIIVLDVGVIMPRKFLRTISIEKDKFISTFFGKYKCEVSRKQPIYYVIFDCKESNFGGVKRFFAVSNEKFVYEVRKPNWRSENRFIDYYDSTKQIIFPYNQETEKLIDYDNWIHVN